MRENFLDSEKKVRHWDEKNSADEHEVLKLSRESGAVDNHVGVTLIEMRLRL